MPTSETAASARASAVPDAIAEEQEEEEGGGETSRSLWRRIFRGKRRRRRKRAHERDIEKALGRRRREGLFSIGRRSRIGMLPPPPLLALSL